MPWVTSLPLVDPVSDLSIHLQGFWHDQPLEATKEGIINFHDWFPFVDDLGHTLSVTTQDTRYVSRRYWPHQVSQSSKDWGHTSHQLLLD